MTAETQTKSVPAERAVQPLEVLEAGPEKAPPVVVAAPTKAVSSPAAVVRRRLLPRATFAILAVLLLGLAADLLVLGEVRHHRDQLIAHADLRESLATGEAPVSQVGPDGRLLPLGTPVAFLEIPRLGLKEVIREGTTSGVLRTGPGHRRDTILPGQIGVSVVMGRQTAFGGPFGRIKELKAGDTLSVTTGQGRHRYQVLGVRRAGDPVPFPQERADGKKASRLTLVTGDGPALMPTGVLRVDADLDDSGDKPSNPKLTPPKVLTAKSLPPSELAMGTDSDAWIMIVLWSQALVAAAILTAWMLRRWGKWQTWIVAVPVLAAIGMTLADELARLLPNLL